MKASEVAIGVLNAKGGGGKPPQEGEKESLLSPPRRFIAFPSSLAVSIHPSSLLLSSPRESPLGQTGKGGEGEVGIAILIPCSFNSQPILSYVPVYLPPPVQAILLLPEHFLRYVKLPWNSTKVTYVSRPIFTLKGYLHC